MKSITLDYFFHYIVAWDHLVTIAHFEPNSIITNINKLKHYRFYEDQQLVTIEPKKCPIG
jgi:hypothetical protein